MSSLILPSLLVLSLDMSFSYQISDQQSHLQILDQLQNEDYKVLHRQKRFYYLWCMNFPDCCNLGGQDRCGFACPKCPKKYLSYKNRPHKNSNTGPQRPNAGLFSAGNPATGSNFGGSRPNTAAISSFAGNNPGALAAFSGQTPNLTALRAGGSRPNPAALAFPGNNPGAIRAFGAQRPSPGALAALAGNNPAALAAIAGNNPAALAAIAGNNPAALAAIAGSNQGQFSPGNIPGATPNDQFPNPAVLAAIAGNNPGAFRGQNSNPANNIGVFPPFEANNPGATIANGGKEFNNAVLPSHDYSNPSTNLNQISNEIPPLGFQLISAGKPNSDAKTTTEHSIPNQFLDTSAPSPTSRPSPSPQTSPSSTPNIPNLANFASLIAQNPGILTNLLRNQPKNGTGQIVIGGMTFNPSDLLNLLNQLPPDTRDQILETIFGPNGLDPELLQGFLPPGAEIGPFGIDIFADEEVDVQGFDDYDYEEYQEYYDNESDYYGDVDDVQERIFKMVKNWKRRYMRKRRIDKIQSQKEKNHNYDYLEPYYVNDHESSYVNDLGSTYVNDHESNYAHDPVRPHYREFRKKSFLQKISENIKYWKSKLWSKLRRMY